MQNLNSSSQSQALTALQIQTVKNHYNSLSQIFNFHQGLTLAERRRMMRPSRQNLLFVQDALDAIAQIPELCPAYLDKADVEETSQLFHQLRFLEQIHQQIGDALYDIRLMAGDKAFRHARLIYNATKSAAEAGYPKARPIYNQMVNRFAIQRNNLPNETEEDRVEIVEDVIEIHPQESEAMIPPKAA